MEPPDRPQGAEHQHAVCSLDYRLKFPDRIVPTSVHYCLKTHLYSEYTKLG